MDFITKKINDRSEIFAYTDKFKEASTLEQSRLEYVLILFLSYLWNLNIDKLGEEDKVYCFKEIEKPSIGSIINLIRRLDISSEIFGNKKFKKFQESLNNYPKIRNEKIGHGFSFNDDSKSLYELLNSLYKTIYEEGHFLISKDINIVKILSDDSVSYKGINFCADGDCSPTTISKNSIKLEKHSLYVKVDINYYKISPFIRLDGFDDFYIFSHIEDKLAERALFNQLINTNRKSFQVPEIIDSGNEIDSNRKKSLNGTIISIFENNYSKYIDTKIVKKIITFLKTNKSTVFATLWGHGGVGKTAAIQRVCETLLLSSNKIFDYIVFVSAKNRKYNYYNGTIEAMDSNVDSYESTIKFINQVVFDKNSTSIDELVNFEGKMFIILDDYETFEDREKTLLINFIKKLNIANHKVVITTRSANSITGEEIEVEELSEKESLEFFNNVLENELSIKEKYYLKKKSKSDLSKKLFEQTNGRPLFIFQCAMVYGETNSITSMLEQNINQKDNAIDFLYGRIFDYLSVDAKRIFSSMSLLVSDADLSNLISKLQYILNMEKYEQRFYRAIDELVKLKIITIIDAKYFKVYSSEVIYIMKSSFKDENGEVRNRLQIIGLDKSLDNNMSLLQDADNSRIIKKPSDVIHKYRHLIARTATPSEIKIKAIINLAQFQIDDRGNYDSGLTTFKEYAHLYNKNYIFVTIYAKYLWKGELEERELSINLINNLLQEDLEYSQYLDLISTLMNYETTMIITDRDSLKDKKLLEEINHEKYEEIYQLQKEEFYRIYTYPGEELFNLIKKDKLKNLKHEVKQKVLNGLAHFIEVCLRRQRNDEIEVIFKYIFNELKYNYHDMFKRKLEKINNTRKIQNKEYQTYIIPGSIGDKYGDKNKKEFEENNLSILGDKLMTIMQERNVTR